MSRDKIVLGRDTYNQVKAMLESSDKENAVVALSCIENGDFKLNITYILLMIKEANVDYNLWKEHAAETCKKYAQLKIGKPLTYKQILETILLYKVPVEDIQFYLDRFAAKLVTDINRNITMDDREITEIKITINPKHHESRTIGESLQGFDVEGSILRDVPDNTEQEVEQ